MAARASRSSGAIFRRTRPAEGPSNVALLIVSFVLPVYLALIFRRPVSPRGPLSAAAARLRHVQDGPRLQDANYPLDAVRASSRKIGVFLLTVLLINIVVGSAMYVIEGPENGFDSMLRGRARSIVTMSTVASGTSRHDHCRPDPRGGADDRRLQRHTGIVSAQFTGADRRGGQKLVRRSCGLQGHESTARHCCRCGAAEIAAPAAAA